MTDCRCGRPTRDDAWLCETCTDRLAADLGDIKWLDDELETTITKVRGAPTEGGSRSAETALPWHDAASEARRHLRGLLHAWVRFCHEDQVRSTDPRHQLPDDTLPAMARWLLWRVDGLALHDIGPEAHDEITDAVADCRRIIDRKPEREFVGPCTCGRDLYRRPGAITVTCRHCDTEHDAEDLLDWMRAQVLGRLVTAREGAGLLSKFGLTTKQATVDKWRQRGLINERSKNSAGHRLYLFDDLVTHASRHAEKASA